MQKIKIDQTNDVLIQILKLIHDQFYDLQLCVGLSKFLQF